MTFFNGYTLESERLIGLSDSEGMTVLSQGTEELLMQSVGSLPVNANYDWGNQEYSSQPIGYLQGSNDREMMVSVDPSTIVKNGFDTNAEPLPDLTSLSQDLFLPDEDPTEQESQESVIDSQDENLVPSIVPWAGKYDFAFVVEKGPTRKLSYSVSRSKLYCLQNAEIEFNFSYNFEKLAGQEMFLRAFMRYTNSEHAATPVARCMNHIHEDTKISAHGNRNHVKENELAHHVLKCTTLNDKQEMLANHYRHKESGRCYISVPMGRLQPGSTSVSKLFKFDCLNSCRTEKSLKKASTTAVFELLKNEKVVGRIAFEVRVCSCPYRDFMKDEPNAETGLPKVTKVKMDKEGEKPSTSKKHSTGTGADKKAGRTVVKTENSLTTDDIVRAAKRPRITEKYPDAQDLFVSSSQESVDEGNDSQPRNASQNKKQKMVSYYHMAKFILSLSLNSDPFLSYMGGSFGRQIKVAYNLAQKAVEERGKNPNNLVVIESQDFGGEDHGNPGPGGSSSGFGSTL